MSKPSSSKLIFLRYLHHHRSKPLSPPNSAISSPPISQILSSNPKLSPWISSSPQFHRPRLLPASVSKIFPNPYLNQSMETNLTRYFVGVRYIATVGSNLGGKLDLNLLKEKIKEPAIAGSKPISRYKHAVGLQIDALWRRSSLVLLGVSGVFVCVLLWIIMFGIANTVMGLSEGMAKCGFLALSSAIVAFAYDMKLLSVDIPMATGPDQLLFLIGDEEYRVCGGLISELRDPVEFEAHDIEEDKEDARRGQRRCREKTS